MTHNVLCLSVVFLISLGILLYVRVSVLLFLTYQALLCDCVSSLRVLIGVVVVSYM